MLRTLVTYLALPALCALSLSIGAHAGGAGGGVVGNAPNSQPLAQATACKPEALVWVDTDEGTSLDDEAGEPAAAPFDGSLWTILGNGTLTVSQGGKTILPVIWVAPQEGTDVPLHGRSGSMTVDGTIHRDAKNKSQGLGELYINQVAEDGKSARCIDLVVDLVFADDGSQAALEDRGFDNCLTALHALTISAGAQAGDAQPIAQATAGPPVGAVWTDTDQGSTYDEKAFLRLAPQFIGSQWTVLDNRILTATKGGKTLFSAAWTADDDGEIRLFHGRSGSMTVDGILYRYPQDMREGGVRMVINQVARDGKSARAIRLQLDLEFDL